MSDHRRHPLQIDTIVNSTLTRLMAVSGLMKVSSLSAPGWSPHGLYAPDCHGRCTQ